MKAWLYSIWQVVWGLPQTVAGLAVFLHCAGAPHWTHHGIVVTRWKYRSSLSLGLFVFVTGTAPYCRNLHAPDAELLDRTLVHEYGHTVQSAILGPLYLAVIGLPSVIWANTPALARRRATRGASYYAFYTERWANALGELVLRRPSMGNAVID